MWLADQPGIRGEGLSATTQRQRLHMLRMFFERIIEWDWADAPARNPIIGRDIPPRREALLKFLDDRDAARLMAPPRRHRPATVSSSRSSPAPAACRGALRPRC